MSGVRYHIMHAGVLWGYGFLHFEVDKVSLFAAEPKVDTYNFSRLVFLTRVLTLAGWKICSDL